MDRRPFKSSIFSSNRAKPPSEKTPPRTGKRQFKYFCGELLGKGSYGRVYLGLNANTGEVMAIKQVELLHPASSPRQKEIIEAFKRESDMLSGLEHEHIVHYLGYEETPQLLSIFLEYVPGGTIKTCLEKYGRFREDVTKSFTSQILSGLEYLHSRAIIHRDLKADNILLEPSGICKISDFGISKQIEDMNDIRAFTGMRGTVQWMAPEIFHTKEGGGYDAKVDIWSVGCVVLEMWSGERPWSGQDVITVMFKLSQYKHPPVPANLRLNPLAEQFRLKCFERNPQDRPTATQLRTHRYLQLPPNWKFPYVMHDRLANRKSKMSSVAMVRPNSFTVDPNAPPVPALKASVGKGAVGNTEPREPLQPLNQQFHHIAATDAHSIPVLDIRPDADTMPSLDQNDGPPVVVITPPGSPKERSFSYEEMEPSAKSSDTSEGTVASRWRRRHRFFVVANPDGDNDLDNHRNFVFTPPPLPETLRRNSTRFYPSETRPSAASPQPPASSSSSQVSGSSSSTGSSILSLTASHTRTNTITGETDDSDDCDDDLHLWNKPPIDLHAPKLTSASSPSLVQTFKPTLPSSVAKSCTLNTHSTRAVRKSKVMRARQSVRPHDSWLVRPDVQEVYDDLENFFPDQDVGQAMVQSHDDITPQPSTKKQSGETSHPFRRMTRLLRGYSVEPRI